MELGIGNRRASYGGRMSDYGEQIEHVWAPCTRMFFCLLGFFWLPELELKIK
jgi:hypothetical protein